MTTSRSSLPALLAFFGLILVLGGVAVVALWPTASKPQPLAAEAARSQNDDLPPQSPLPESSPLTEADAKPLPDRVTSQADVHAVVQQTRAMQQAGVPALRKAALESQDSTVAGNAIRALGRLHAFAGDSELVKLLDDRRSRVRQEAVIALGLSQSEDAVAKLVPLLTDHDQTLRVLVLQALGRLGGPTPEACLRTAVADASASEAERVMAQQALATLHDASQAKRTTLAARPPGP